jgi:hypothetical protein
MDKPLPKEFARFVGIKCSESVNLKYVNSQDKGMVSVLRNVLVTKAVASPSGMQMKVLKNFNLEKPLAFIDVETTGLLCDLRVI